MTTTPKPTPEQIAVALEEIEVLASGHRETERKYAAIGHSILAGLYCRRAAALEAVAKWLEEMK